MKKKVNKSLQENKPGNKKKKIVPGITISSFLSVTMRKTSLQILAKARSGFSQATTWAASGDLIWRQWGEIQSKTKRKIFCPNGSSPCDECLGFVEAGAFNLSPHQPLANPKEVLRRGSGGCNNWGRGNWGRNNGSRNNCGRSNRRGSNRGGSGRGRCRVDRLWISGICVHNILLLLLPRTGLDQGGRKGCHQGSVVLRVD